MKRSATGTRITAGRTDIVSWSVEYTWTRLPFLSKATTVYYTDVLGAGYDFSVKSGDPDVENLVLGDFYMVQFPLVLDGIGNGWFDPKRQAPTFLALYYEESVTTQTWTDTLGGSGSDTATKRLSPQDMSFLCSTPPTTPRYTFDRWAGLGAGAGFDLTTLTPAQWRDMRGVVFSVATAEVASGSVTYTDVVETAEWKLG